MSWKGVARLFEDASYQTLWDLEMGPDGYEGAPDEYVTTLLPILARWKTQLEKKRDEFRRLPASDYRTHYEGWLREEAAAYQRALLKLSEAWLLYFFVCDSNPEIPVSLAFDVDAETGGAR
ncbi:hypothetical protein AB0N23_02550 [Streptomyces sp. NPDC052644]